MSTSTSLTKLAIAAVTASGNETGNGPANTTDRSLTTRWSNLGKGSWIQYDLGSGYTGTIAQVDIAWYSGNTRKSTFTISVSGDGSAFNQVFGGQSSGTTANFEAYQLTPSPASGRYVRITVNGNTQNDWASITETEILASASSSSSTSTTRPQPVPSPVPVPTTGLDENGVKMIYPTSPSGIHYTYKMSDNIQSSNYITTDENYNPTQMTEGGVTFKRLTAGDVHYSTGTGKTCRVNVNGGGFLAVQTHTWQNQNGYIWTSLDSKNSEFTYYFRVENFKYDHTSCSTKMHSGIHTQSNDPRASCFETCFFIGGSSPGKMEAAYEYNHPNYVFESITQNSSASGAKAGQWIGRKTCVWNGADGKVHTEDYCDWAPFDSSGKPVNNWTKIMSKTFGGTSTNGYTKAPTWGGMTTIRIDGYQYVDMAIISIREITPPS